MFSGVLGALGTQAGLEKAAFLSGGTIKTPYSLGLFGTSGAVKNTA